MFTAFGLFFVAFAQQYDMGTAARMGPAFFPTVLGGLLLLLGVVVAFKGLTVADDGKVDRFHFKPLCSCSVPSSRSVCCCNRPDCSSRWRR